MLECVVNISEGRSQPVLERLASAAAPVLLDVHRDGAHHRAVFTLGGDPGAVEESARELAATAVALVDLTGHRGAHPRLGSLDVVPFVALAPEAAGQALRPTAPGLAVAARDRFTRWAGSRLELPCFCYGPVPHAVGRTLPEVRRGAFRTLAPDAGPPVPHPTAGACAVGARGALVAFNIWLAGGSLAAARQVAAAVRRPEVRALGLDCGGRFQISCNLVDPWIYGPDQLVDEVRRQLRPHDAGIERCELVGLVPAAVLERVPASRWPALDLEPGRTIEARLGEAAFSRR